MNPSTPADGDESSGLLSNLSAMLVGRIGIAIFGWVGTVIIVRSLDTEQFGQFSFVFSLLGMLSILTSMGIGRVAIAGVLDESRDQATFAGTYVVLRTLLGVVGYLAAVGFVVVAQYPTTVVQATALAGINLLVATPSNAFDIAFQARLRLNTVAVAGVVGQAAQLAITVAIALRGGALLWFVLAPVLAEVVILAIKMPRARRLMAFRYNVNFAVWVALAKEAVPLSIGGLLATLSYRVDSVMLSKMDTFDSVGAYGVAYKFADLAEFASTALTVPILTILVKAWPEDLDRFRAAVRQGAIYLSFIAGLLIVEFWLFSDPLIRLLYGADYLVSAPATRILITATVFAFFSRLAFNALIAANRHRWYPLVALIGLVSNVAINLVLIPRYSFEGAAFATLVTEVVTMAVMWALLVRVPGLRPIQLGFLFRVAGAIGVALAIGATARPVMPWVVAASCAGFGYLLAAHVLKAPGQRGLRSLLEDRLG